MKTVLLLLAVVTYVTICLSATDVLQSTNSYLTAADKAHAKRILEPGFKLTDVSAVYYAILGYSLLGEAVPGKQEICNFLISAVKDVDDITAEKGFHIAFAWKNVGICQGDSISIVSKLLRGVIEKESSTISELYFAISGLNVLSEKLSPGNVENITKVMQNTLRKDDNLWNLGYAFHIASKLETVVEFAFDRIEDAVIQADEVDGQYLQFEGGLSVTSFLVTGIFKLSNSLKKRPPLTFQQTVKMANYLLSRRSVQTPKGVTGLLSALTVLASNDFGKLISVTLADEGIDISNRKPFVTVKVCDVLGNAFASPIKVIANSATRIGDDNVVLAKQPFQLSSEDRTLYKLNLMDVKPERGFYKISITAESVTNTVTVKVLCDVMVDHLEIGTGDADQTTQPKLTKIAYPEKLGQKIEADSQQKLVMRFLLRDAANKKSMRAHQAFVRLSSASSTPESIVGKRGHEIIFVAEPDTSNLYKFDMPVGVTAANFDHQSGDYNVELIVGDAVLSNPFRWTIATVNLKFPEPVGSEQAGKSASHKQKLHIYSSKPEIKHMFREPEKRPPAFVSNLFSSLCLAPVLLLFILWVKLGVNISNFPLSVSAVTFHLGLGSIFVLFGIFWLKLNMFLTLRYLLGLGVVTFLAGNKMLSRIALKHKSR